jgi:predicted membrane protein
VHYGLAVAITFSTAAAWVETLAAALLVAGSALFVAGVCANWLQGIGDHFAARSLGWKLLTASSAGHIPGIAIILAAVLATR